MRQKILIFAGILGFILGVIFMLQGLGVIRYPADSFMIDNRVWITRGGIIAFRQFSFQLGLDRLDQVIAFQLWMLLGIQRIRQIFANA